MSYDGVEDHLEYMQSKLSDAWEHLNGIWQRIGYDEEALIRRRKIVVKHFTELLEDMCQEAAGKLEEQQMTIKTLMQEIMQLGEDLSIEQVPELESASGKPLLEMQKIFLDVVDDLRQRKAIRMAKYNEINSRVQEISEELDEAPMQIEFKGIPADSQVNKLHHHLTQLEQEKVQRLQQFYNYKKSITELFGLLEKTPKNEFELLISIPDDEINSTQVVSESGIKVLSRETLQALERLRERSIEQLDANTQQGNLLWQKIRELWSRLTADEEMMLIFSQVHQPISASNWMEIYKPSVLKGLQKELERLEEEKRLNMSLFIKQCREELCKLWLNKCFMTSVQDRFMEPNYARITPFAIADFNEEESSEELLEKHEQEVEFWQNFIERNKRIIDGVVKRGEMFGQYKILDQKSDDPSRLANRGGALLKEEKERKKLEKAIPKLESELKQLCDEFEMEQDAGYGMTKFLVYGRTIDEMIEQDWEQFHEEKRLRKEAKKKPNDGGGNKTLMTTQLGNQGTRKRPATPSSAQRGTPTPVKRNKTAASTPGKTIPSPFLQPSIAGAPSNSMKRPLTSKENFAQPASRSAKKTPPTKPGVLTRQPSAGKIVFPTKLTGKEQVPPSSSDKNSKDSVISPVASYSEFTDHLLCQSTLNSSTVVPVHKQVPGPNGSAPTTPTKSGMSFAPAKLPLTDNCF